MVQRHTLQQAEAQPQPRHSRPKPALAFAADEEGFLVIRCSVVSGDPHILRKTEHSVVAGDVEESTIAKLSLDVSDAEFKENLAFLLTDMREQVSHEMQSKRGLPKISVKTNEAAKGVQNTHVNVTIYRQMAGKKAWQGAAHEVTPATHIAISIPLSMPERRATSKLDSFLDSVRRVALREKGCSLN